MLFSCSGNSKNILETLKILNKLNLTTILVTGFSKKIFKNVKIHLNLNCKNYVICEDIFSSLMHMISQKIQYESVENKNKKNIVL